MNAVRIIGIVLIIAGTAALVYGGFSFTKETHQAKIGPIELTVKDKEDVNIPSWAGVGAILLGGVLLVVGGKKP
jgi:drug/metabolite transporter (DMT)-like permease